MASKTSEFNWLRGDLWWKKEETAFDKLFALVDAVSVMSNNRSANFMRYAALYGNSDMFNSAATVYGRLSPDVKYSRLTYNVTQSVVDTLVSRFAANQPRVEVLTEGGDWEQQQKAKNSTKFLSGEFERLKINRIVPLVWRDALVFGDGYIKVSAKHYDYDDEDGKTHRGAKIDAYRVFPGEILVDQNEALNGDPRTLFQVRLLSRDVIAATWPEYADKIAVAGHNDPSVTPSPFSNDMIRVIEAWHLPSGPGAKDGRRAVVISNCVLEWEDWDEDFFPFVRFSWCKPMQGWYSQGIVDQLMPMQVELNKLMKRTQLAMHLMSVPQVWIQHGTKLSVDAVNNEVGAQVKYTGAKPDVVIPPAMSGEVYQLIDRFYSRAYEVVGVSPMESKAQKPVGLESAPSLREYSDQASERHAYPSMEFQEGFRDLARLILKTAGEIVERYGTCETYGASKDRLQLVDYKDCRVNKDSFIFKIQNANLLPTTPAGKLQKVQDMAQNGILTPVQALRALEFPDMQALVGDLGSFEDYLDFVVHILTQTDKPLSPEPFMDLNSAVSKVTAEYWKAQEANASEYVLNRMRTYIRDCMSLQQDAENAAMQQQMQQQAQAQMQAQAQAQAGNAAQTGK